MSKRREAGDNAFAGEEVTLTLLQAFNLWVALRAMENDEELTVATDVRIKVAINQDRLFPLASQYERSRKGMIAQVSLEHRKSLGADFPAGQELPSDVLGRLDAAVIEEDEKLRLAEHTARLCTVLRSELRLEDNPKIKLSALLPIVSDLR